MPELSRKRGADRLGSALTGSAVPHDERTRDRLRCAGALAPGVSLSETRRADTLSGALRELRRGRAEARGTAPAETGASGPGARDGIAETTFVERIATGAGTLIVADIEPIPPERMQEIMADLAAELDAERAQAQDPQ